MLKKIMLGILVFICASFAIGKTANILDIAAQAIEIKNARVELAEIGPYGQKNFSVIPNSTEVKMDLINRSNKDAILVAVTSPMATKIQLHEMLAKTNTPAASMKQIREITIPPHHEIDLSYRGIHIMLMGLKRPLYRGESIPITLIFADGSYLSVNVHVSG